MRSVLRSVALVPALALSLLTTACGGGGAPKTAEEAANLAFKAIVEGKADVIRPALPTKADFEELIKKEGKEAKAEKIDGELKEIEEKVPSALTELQSEAKAGGLDLAQAKLTDITSKEDVDDGVTELRIEGKVTSGTNEAQLRVRAVKLDRGLIMFRPPRLETMGLCKKAIANVAKITTGVDNEMAKSMNKAFTGDVAGLEAECEAGVKEKPDQKGQVECMAGAADFAALEACMKR